MVLQDDPGNQVAAWDCVRSAYSSANRKLACVHNKGDVVGDVTSALTKIGFRTAIRAESRIRRRQLRQRPPQMVPLQFSIVLVPRFLPTEAISDRNQRIEQAPLGFHPRLQQAVARGHGLTEIRSPLICCEEFFVIRTPVRMAEIPPDAMWAKQFVTDIDENLPGKSARRSRSRMGSSE